MFIQPCMVKPTFIKVATDELERLGIQKHPGSGELKPGSYIYVNRGFYSSIPIGYQEELENTIDCRVNHKLFLALAALRDDSDKFQWLTDGIHWEFCTEPKLDENLIRKWKNYYGEQYIPHKASVEELLVKFNYY